MEPPVFKEGQAYQVTITNQKGEKHTLDLEVVRHKVYSHGYTMHVFALERTYRYPHSSEIHEEWGVVGRGRGIELTNHSITIFKCLSNGPYMNDRMAWTGGLLYKMPVFTQTHPSDMNPVLIERSIVKRQQEEDKAFLAIMMENNLRYWAENPKEGEVPTGRNELKSQIDQTGIGTIASYRFFKDDYHPVPVAGDKLTLDDFRPVDTKTGFYESISRRLSHIESTLMVASHQVR